MTFETIENVLNINTDAIMTLAMAAVLLVIGYFIKNKLTILDRYCIPAPVALLLTSPTHSRILSCWLSLPR